MNREDRSLFAAGSLSMALPRCSGLVQPRVTPSPSTMVEDILEPMPGGVMADITKNPPPEPGAPTRMSMSSPRPNQPVFSPRILPPGASADANFTTEDLLASTPVEYLLSTKPLDHEKHAFLVERLRSADSYNSISRTFSRLLGANKRAHVHAFRPPAHTHVCLCDF
jgi:hypothetical protein